MKKTSIYGTKLELYEEVLFNGMRIFIIPMPKFSSHFVTFTTNFGSNDLSFRKKDATSFTEVNPGIAHFLEHKMFEQKNGKDPFSFFSANSANCNANTSNLRTTYLFEGRENLKENLNFLLDFVQDIHLTDKNVEKEKGIILEEEKMYFDAPHYRLYDMSMKNTFVNNNYKTSVIGTPESIMAITKEELIECYNHFYHPSQMYLIAVGNIDPDNFISIVKENQKSKNYQKPYEIVKEEIDEPENVTLAYEEILAEIETPKVMLAYKILNNLDIDHEEFTNYLSMYALVKLGKLSQFNEELLKEQKIISSLDIFVQESEPYSIIQIVFEGEKVDEVIDEVDEQLNDLHFDEDDFNLIKKDIINKFKDYSDKPEHNNYFLLEQLAKNNKINVDYLKDIENLNAINLKEIIKTINFKNRSVSKIKPFN
jgi:predicted Zn-dependent peptidase